MSGVLTWIIVIVAAFVAGGAVGIIGSVMFVREVRAMRDALVQFVNAVARQFAKDDYIDVAWEERK